jgi:hypothetical protein
VVSGIIETRYRVAALSLRLDPKLVGAGGAAASAAHDVLATIFDEVQADVERALANPPRDDDPTLAKPFVTRGLARLSPARGAELRRRLQALLEEYDEPSAGPDTETIRFLIAMYVDPSKEASRG